MLQEQLTNFTSRTCTAFQSMQEGTKASIALNVPSCNHPFKDTFSASVLFKKALKEKGFSVCYESFKNSGRDFLVYAQRGSKATCFYLKFKKEFFYSFGTIFNNEAEAGESINAGLLDSLIKQKVDVLIFAHSPHFYYVYPHQIKNYCEDKGLIREQDCENYYNREDYSGKTAPIHEKTYCFPLSLLQNFEHYGNPNI